MKKEKHSCIKEVSGFVIDIIENITDLDLDIIQIARVADALNEVAEILTRIEKELT